MPPHKPSRPTEPQHPQRIQLAQLLHPTHPLVKLAQALDWSVFETQFEPLYDPSTGRPGLPTRLLVGLHYLKHLFDVSDETVVQGFVENPYWQYLCGFEYFQHERPCHPTSLVKWRKRVGAQQMERLLQETLEAAKRVGALRPQEMEQVHVDTTVQEKAIAFPTDARLYHKARQALVRAAQRAGIRLRQSYGRLSKWALAQQSRYAQAKQWKRARKQTRKLRTYLGRVLRDLRRRCAQPAEKLEQLLQVVQRIYQQQRTDQGKVYSVHAPEVDCICKGKAHRRYEFGCKVALATSARRGWVLGIQAVPGNPYDGRTLGPVLEQVQRLTGVKVRQAFVDRGFRGQAHHPPGVEVYLSGRRKLSRTLKLLLRRRSAIEPVISHLKADHRMERNPLLGTAGDRIQALLTGCGFNLRKLWRALAQLLLRWLLVLTGHARQRSSLPCA